MSVNKFLGIDSINVLKEYIDNTIHQNNYNSRVLTLHAYKYVLSTETVQTPVGGTFDSVGAELTYPENWGSLDSVIRGFTYEYSNPDEQNAAIENALKNGSIYMSAGVLSGGSDFKNWSTPVKISGQNGVTILFEYSYDTNGNNRTTSPKGVSASNPYEYVWTKYGDDEWVGPKLWAVYATNASVILYRYRTTAEPTQIPAPTSNIDPDWSTSASSSIAQDKPYMWMSWKYVPAFNPQTEEPSDEGVWSEPILFGHYGTDGANGLNGNIPAYSVTLYTKTDIIDGEIVKPEFVCNEGDNIDNVKESNPDWNELPMIGNEKSVWWYVVINVNGGGDEEKPVNTVNSVSEVMRFSAIDGELKSYPTVRYEYYWSSNQDLPAGELEWLDAPVHNNNDIEGSLWMRCAEFVVNTITNTEEQTKEWSTPIKITGPRGPIAYDYRAESQFAAGDENSAKTAYKNTIYEVDLTKYTYLWEKRYLMLYKMKYNNNGEVIEDTSVSPKIIKTIGEFRLSGLNGVQGENGKDGANGNRQNSIHYATIDDIEPIYNFDETNYFISNSAEDTHYTINGNKFGDFESGYTGKFTNIGIGNMIITTIDAKIVGSNTNVTEIVVKPQESIDLIGYNNNGVCEFILIGKSITDINNPIENPGVLSDTELLQAISVGGEVKLGKDIIISTPIEINGNDVTVDLNGYEINAKDAWIDESDNSTNAYAFWVKDGNLIIRGNGKVTATDADYSMAVWCQGGNVTIESGEFRNGGESCSLIYASGTGNIVIKGGKYIATPIGEQIGTGDEYTALNLKDRDNMTCSISVEGGHYYKFDPANNSAEDNAEWWEAHPNGFVADGYTSIKNGDYYSVIKNPEI